MYTTQKRELISTRTYYYNLGGCLLFMSFLHFTLLDTSSSLLEEWKDAFTKYETASMRISFI
jgi:hypothetical protein